MKKAKVLLMGICTLAVVGGALAFKAAKFNQHNYCTTTELGDFCNVFDNNLKNVPSSGTVYQYTDIGTGTSCASQQACIGTTTFVAEQ